MARASRACASRSRPRPFSALLSGKFSLDYGRGGGRRCDRKKMTQANANTLLSRALFAITTVFATLGALRNRGKGTTATTAA